MRREMKAVLHRSGGVRYGYCELYIIYDSILHYDVYIVNSFVLSTTWL